MSTLLFVYGTLRKGGENQVTRLYPTSVFVGDASVNGKLFDMGGYPAIRLDDGGGSIIGEVYEIDDETLAKLDEFETDAGYDRMPIEIAVNGETRKCWIYGPPAGLSEGKPQIASGDWIGFLNA